jgi:hypothetical protein
MPSSCLRNGLVFDDDDLIILACLYLALCNLDGDSAAVDNGPWVAEK